MYVVQQRGTVSAIRYLAKQLGATPQEVVGWVRQTQRLPPCVLLSWICRYRSSELSKIEDGLGNRRPRPIGILSATRRAADPSCLRPSQAIEQKPQQPS